MDRIEMTIEETPEWLPYVARIFLFPDDSEPEISKIIEKLFLRYGGVHSEEFDRLEVRSGGVISGVRYFKERNSQILLLSAGSYHMEAPYHILEYRDYEERIERIREDLPKEPESTINLRFAYTKDAKNAESLLEKFAEGVGQHARSSGFVRSSLLASLRGSGGSYLATPLRELIAITFGTKPKEVAVAAWALCSEIGSLAFYIAEMIRLYSRRRLMFEQMDSSERSTQLRINEILADMRRPVDDIQAGDLEKILREITIQFSRLSTLASSMRRDHVKAQGLLRGMNSLVERWNERPLGESLTNSSAELSDFHDLISPFGDFIERTEALMAQLNTVLDSVRTYLGIQQQKMSIVEQTSSREQLVRLVNLQEILHKLEILIVAVYLTEMARIIFETSFHESANLLTALFIPIALLISILISRILHKNH